MTLITKDMTVRDVVNRFPQTMRVFSAYGIDMCCGGVHSIEYVASVKRVSNLETLLKELNQKVAITPSDKMPV